MASPSPRRPHPKAGASTLRSVKGGRKSHWRSSRRRQAKVRSPLPVPVSCAVSESSATFITSQDFSIVSSGMSRSPSTGGEARQVFPSAVTAPGSSHVARQVTIRGSHSETSMDKRVSFRNTSAQVTMERQEEVSTWDECFPLTEPLRSGARSHEPFGFTSRGVDDCTRPASLEWNHMDKLSAFSESTGCSSQCVSQSAQVAPLVSPMLHRGCGLGSSGQLYLCSEVVPMGWVSPTRVIQHVHRRLLTSSLQHPRCLEPAAEVRRDWPLLAEWSSTTGSLEFVCPTRGKGCCRPRRALCWQRLC